MSNQTVIEDTQSGQKVVKGNKSDRVVKVRESDLARLSSYGVQQTDRLVVMTESRNRWRDASNSLAHKLQAALGAPPIDIPIPVADSVSTGQQDESEDYKGFLALTKTGFIDDILEQQSNYLRRMSALSNHV